MAAGRVAVFKLKGGPELQARLRAIGQTFKPLGRKWADEAVTLAKSKVPVGTRKHGPKDPPLRLRESIRRTHATMKRATVGGNYTAYFIDAGTHYPSKSRKHGRTIFSKKSGYRTQPRPFRAYVAHEALRRHPIKETLVKLWNDAA